MLQDVSAKLADELAVLVVDLDLVGRRPEQLYNCSYTREREREGGRERERERRERDRERLHKYITQIMI